MKRSVVVVGAWLAIVACGGGGAAPDKPVLSRSEQCTTSYCATSEARLHCGDSCPPDAGPSTFVTMTSSDAGAVALADAASVAPSLPPPKPTTLSLAKTGDAKADAELTLGDAAFSSGDFAGAEKHYMAARASSPKSAPPLVGLARVRIAKTGAPLDFGAAKGNVEIKAALADLKKALAIAPDFGPLHAEAGGALLMLGEAEQSLASLRRAAELLPQEAEAQSMLGVALLATGQRDAAVVQLQKAADLDMGRSERHGNLGTVLLLVGKVPEAVREFELQARIADGDARAHSDLGAALLAANDVARATAELQRATQLDPSKASYHVNLGYALQRQNRLADAIAEYRKAIQEDDKLSSAWVNLATALARDPKTREKACDALGKAKAIDPSDPNVKANLDELEALEPGVCGKSAPSKP